MLRTLAALLLVSGAWAQCTCSYLSQPPDGHDADNWPTFYIMNPTNSAFNPCEANCTYFMDSGNPTLGIGDYYVYNWQDDGGQNSLSVYDCDDSGVESNALLFNATVSSPKNSSFRSSGQYVCVELRVVKPVTILVGMERTSIGTTAAPRKTTKPPVPTTPYNGNYSHDPSLVSLDVLFMVDGGDNNKNSQAFDESKALAAAIVNAFNPNTVFAQNASVAPAYGSRMTLRFLVNVNNQFIGTPWNQNATFISKQICNLFQVNSKTPYNNSLTSLLDPSQSVFLVNNTMTPEQNSRPTAERMVVIVASSVPDDLDAIATKSMQDMFTALDVHPVFIAYNMSKTDFTSIKTKLFPFWGVTNVQTINNLDAIVQNFFDDYLLDAGNVCYGNTTVVGPDTTEQSVFHPSNYKVVKDSWDENHQTGRYCNFQQLTYTFTADSSAIIQFTVTYELEPGKDTLNFYQDDGTEIVSLSGVDIGPSMFYARGTVIAEFNSNESQVFGGFKITYKTVTSVPTIPPIL